MIDRNRLTEEVMWRSGIREPGDAEAVIAAIVEVLTKLLAPADALWVERELPVNSPTSRTSSEQQAPASPQELYERLAIIEDVNLGVAVEHVRTAASVIMDLLDADLRTLLARRLPVLWAALFASTPRQRRADFESGTLPGHGHTLATGRPGSSHPLADAAPVPVHAASVVSATNSQEDTKLSSAATVVSNGLATAHGGAEDSIAEARDERAAH